MRFLLGSGLTLAIAACSSTSAPPPPAAPADAGPEAAADAAPVFAVSLGATVAPTEDSYHCKYVAVPSGAGFLVGASHTYGPGCHHVLVFRTDLAAMPAGGDVERDCFAPDDAMPHARAQIYGAQSKTGSFAMPAATGLPLRDGEVLLVQVHYLNATAAPVDARVDLTLTTAAGGITQKAGAFYFADPFIDVGAGQKARATIRCAIPQDATLLTTSGYAHARAVDFAAFVDPKAGPPATAPYYHAPGTANPLPLQTATPVPAGSRVRFTCMFDNTRGASEVLGGPKNDTDEACVLTGLYVPDLGDDVSACRAGPDDFGTGAATCSATRTCVDACPAGSAPPADLGLGRGVAIDPCWQRCIAASCADASALLFAERACTQAPCANEVAACNADACL